jgi:hypothetical protein
MNPLNALFVAWNQTSFSGNCVFVLASFDENLLAENGVTLLAELQKCLLARFSAPRVKGRDGWGSRWEHLITIGPAQNGNLNQTLNIQCVGWFRLLPPNLGYFWLSRCTKEVIVFHRAYR